MDQNPSVEGSNHRTSGTSGFQDLATLRGLLLENLVVMGLDIL